jgi:hypothetical protein
MRRCRLLAVPTALLALAALPAAAEPPDVQLTEVGNPIWRPADFHLFSAPAAPFPSMFHDVVETLVPNDGFSGAYVAHAGPYTVELAAGVSAASFVDRTEFVAEDIDIAPNAVYFAFVVVPDPGVLGASRDAASGPIIPNSVSPIERDIDMWLDGARVDRLLGADSDIPDDVAYDGFSHAVTVHVVWHPWDDDLEAGPNGSYEIRESLRDFGGNGWDMVVPFVVPEASRSELTLVVLTLIAVLGSRTAAARDHRA